MASLRAEVAQLQLSRREQHPTLAQAASGPALQLLPAIRSPPAVKLRRTLKGHFGKCTAFHWSGDSERLVSVSQDGNMLLWNALTNNKIQSIALRSSYVMAVGFEQTMGNMVASGGLDNICTVYPLKSPDKAVELASHDGFLSCCRFLDEKEILTASGDSTVILWDIATARPVSTFAEHTKDAMFLSLKPGDRNFFATCSVDTTTKLWDVRAPQAAVATFTGHTADVNGVEFMPSEPNCLGTCSQDNTVRLYDIRAYNELACYSTGAPSGALGEAEANDGLTSLTFSRSGRLVFCGTADGSVVAFDVLASSSSAAPTFTLQQAHERQVSGVGISPVGDALCTTSWDGLLKIWA